MDHGRLGTPIDGGSIREIRWLVAGDWASGRSCWRPHPPAGVHAHFHRRIPPHLLGLRRRTASRRFGSQVASSLRRACLRPAGVWSATHMMARNIALLICVVLLGAAVSAQENKSAGERAIPLDEAVKMAFENNHYVRLAADKVAESVHAKEAVRSAYLPNLKNDSM